jgi:hypothetical protein
MGIRRYILSLKSSSFPKGEKPIFIQKGEYPILDALCRNTLRLPEKTLVFHYSTRKILPPIEFIGGREVRPPGDTCRMFYKIKQLGKDADYFFWDGIVPEHLQELGECYKSEFDEIVEDMSNVYFKNPSTDIGLATGRTCYRIVLLEKIKKVPQSGKPS